MKNFFVFFLFLFISTISFSQKQGLGLLPTQGILNISRTVGEGSQILNTICVNGNLSAPNRGSIYRHVTGGDNVHFKVNGKDYPGGFQKAVEDEILILKTEGIESVKVSINPNKPDIKSIEIGVFKGGTVLSESHALAVENHYEEISKASPEVLQDQWGYWELSSRIENLKKTGYLKTPIQSKTDLENAEKLFSRDFPNEYLSEVAQKQEQLKELGYFKQAGTPQESLNESEKLFNRDFPNKSLYDVVRKKEQLKELGYFKQEGNLKESLNESEKLFKNDFPTESLYEVVRKKDQLKELGYFKQEVTLKESEKLFKTDFPTESLSEVVRKKDQLKELGYFKQEVTLKESEKLFKNDFGNQTLSQVIGKLERIESFNKSTENNYPVFYINKSETSGQYILFNKFDKPIFKSSDERELGKTIEVMLNEHDNAFLSLNGFETLEKEASFVSTLNISNKTQGKNIYFNKVDMENAANNGILFTKRFQHKIFKDVDKSAITSTDYNGQQYFKSDIFIESKDSYGWYDNEVAHVEALAKKEDVLVSLLNNVSSVFKSFTENLSLGLYFNTFKKQLKKDRAITSEDEFIILLRSETLDLRIVKIEGSNELYFSEN